MPITDKATEIEISNIISALTGTEAQMIVRKMAFEIGQLRRDAKRYEFIRENLVQSHTHKMDSQKSYRFRVLRFRGRTFEDALDTALKLSEKE